MPSFVEDVEFTKVLAGSGEANLVRLMLEVAADAYPRLDRDVCLAEIDRLGSMAARAVASLSQAAPLEERLEEISRVLYVEEGFHGNEECYYDPRNSYLNEVLLRRTGIPISLAIVYMAVAERAGVRLHGVGTPGHFVVGAREGVERWFVDPFNDGSVLSLGQCRQRVEAVLGQPDSLDEADFGPATTREILLRVLRNLKVAQVMANDWSAALPVQRRLALLLPDDCQQRRDLGLMYLRTCQPQEALPILEEYVRTCDADEDEAMQPFLRTARRMLAELN